MSRSLLGAVWEQTPLNHPPEYDLFEAVSGKPVTHNYGLLSTNYASLRCSCPSFWPTWLFRGSGLRKVEFCPRIDSRWFTSSLGFGIGGQSYSNFLFHCRFILVSGLYVFGLSGWSCSNFLASTVASPRIAGRGPGSGVPPCRLGTFSLEGQGPATPEITGHYTLKYPRIHGLSQSQLWDVLWDAHDLELLGFANMGPCGIYVSHGSSSDNHHIYVYIHIYTLTSLPQT